MDTFRGLKLLAHCGGGAFGDVYFCEDITGKKMAVKIISKKRIGDSWERELTGVKNYRKITENAPGLLQIFHVEDDEENFFYTMEPADSVSVTEYVPDTLACRLKSGALPQTDLFRVLSGVFNGIKTLHDAGFAHRDIKPDNILFVKGVPKLADIGLLSALSHTVTQLAGTLDFIPPEERTAESLESSDKASRQRNDLYAFGKVIYCAVTGIEPHQYPSVPRDFPFDSPVKKYFLNLAFELCSKEPYMRLNSIEELAKEMADIERKLLYGETLLDKIRYAAKQFRIGVKISIVSSLRFIKRYWYLVLLFLLVGGGTAYWIWKPKPPIDVTKLKSKPYKNAEHKISMTIPYHWEIITKKTSQAIINSGVKPEKLTQKQFEVMREAAEKGEDTIFCDFGTKMPDIISVVVLAETGDFFKQASEDKLRLLVKSKFEEESEFKCDIYGIEKKTIAGYPVRFFDLSYLPDTRVNSYFIFLKNKMLLVTLTAKNTTFKQRRDEFESVLKTIKIEK